MLLETVEDFKKFESLLKKSEPARQEYVSINFIVN